MKCVRLTIGSLLLIGLGMGCSKSEPLVGFENLNLLKRGYAAIEAQFCTETPTEYRQKLKYIFILDKSSSNQNPEYATDPYGDRRYAPLYDFVNSAPDDPGYTFYSLINFSTAASVVQTLTDDREAFRDLVNNQWQKVNGTPRHPLDQGYTNYLGALQAAYDLIKADADLERNAIGTKVVTSVYTIVFVSDGTPKVPNNNPPPELLRQADADIENRVNLITALRNDANYKGYIDEIVLHTGFYFTPTADPAILTELEDARTLLSQMAVWGDGDGYQFGGGVNIDYRLFAVPVRNVRFSLNDIFVENANTVWWDDGVLYLDSDRDGLPDQIEGSMGSNAGARDSDGNGVSDYVEYLTKGRPCKDAHCSRLMSQRDNYAACTGLMPLESPGGGSNPLPDGVNTPPQGTVFFGDLDNDGVNDCEEWVLRSNRVLFDTNGDFIPDYLALKNRVSLIPGSNEASGDPDADSVKNYTEIKLGQPTFFDNSKLINFKAIQYDLLKTSTNENTDCFSLKVKSIATVGQANLIRVWMIQNTSIIDNKPVLKKAEAELIGDQLFFKANDFK